MVDCEQEESYLSNPLRERKSTSLWTLDEGVMTNGFVCSYESAGRPALAEYGVGSHPSDHSMCINIQLVKKRQSRSSKPYYTVVIDGMESVTTDNVHGLCTHKGWNFDPITKRYVVSPCSFSLVIEDGERPPDKCEVFMYMKRPYSDGDPLFAGRSVLKEFSVRDTVYSTAITSYPCSYPPPMRVSFMDYSRVYKQQMQNTRKTVAMTLQEILPVAIKNILEYISYSVTENTFSNSSLSYVIPTFIVNMASSALLQKVFGTAAGAASLSGLTVAGGLASLASVIAAPLIGTVMLGVISAIKNYNIPGWTEEGSKRQREIQNVGAAAAFVIEATFGAEEQVAVAAAQRLNKFFGPTTAPSLFSSSSDVFTKDNVTKMLGAGVQQAINSTYEYIMQKPAPEPLRVSFTLSDFAESIETLAVIKSRDAVNISKSDTKKFFDKYRRQRLIWQWLQDPEPKRSVFKVVQTAVTQVSEDGFKRKGNPLDISECSLDDELAVKTYIEVLIDDTDICSQDYREKHTFTSKRDDAGFLGAVSNNELYNIHRVKSAIAKLKESLEDSLNRVLESRNAIFKWAAPRKVATGFIEFFGTIFKSIYSATAITFYEYIISYPILRDLLKSDINEEQMMREVSSILNSSEGVLRRVIDNIPLKLQRHFDADISSSVYGSMKFQSHMSTRYAMQQCPPLNTLPTSQTSGSNVTGPTNSLSITEFFKVIRDINTVIRLFIIDNTQYPEGFSKKGLICRHLPQVTGSQTYLFPQVAVLSSDALDIVDTSLAVRESSRINDAVQSYNSYSSKASAAFKHILEESLDPSRRGFLLLHYYPVSNDTYPSGLDMKALEDKALKTPVDSFALQLGPPSDIFNVLSFGNKTESTGLRVKALIGQEDSLHHGLKPTWQHVCAVQFYAEVVTVELVKQRQCHTEDWERISFSSRDSVDSAVYTCAEFVLSMCTKERVLVLFEEGPDTFANETRMYAQLLVRRMHVRHPKNSGALNSLRMVALALKEISRNKKLDWKTLPVEPLASLRMCYKRGQDAFRRATTLLPDDQGGLEAHARSLIASSYPVLLFQKPVTSDEEEDPCYPGDPGDARVYRCDACASAEHMERFMSALKRRFESLRINFDEDGTDGIERRLESVSLEGSKAVSLEYGRFFIPFGYGAGSPPLHSPLTPAFMFTSVPVLLEYVLAAIQHVLKAVQNGEDGTSQGTALVPAFTKCRSPEESYAINDPSEFVYEYNCIRFLASYVGATGDGIPKLKTATTATDAAKLATQSKFTFLLSDIYSSIAWNSERILQCILMASCQGVDSYSLHLPGGTDMPPEDTTLENKRRAAIQEELAYYLRRCYDTVRGILEKVAVQLDNVFSDKKAKDKAMSKLFNATMTPGIFTASDDIGADTYGNTTNVSKTIATGVSGGTPALLEPFDIFAGPEPLSGNDLLPYRKDFIDKCQSLFDNLYSGNVDFRRLLKNISNTASLATRKFLVLGPQLRDDFTYSIGDGDDLELKDLSTEEKTQLLDNMEKFDFETALASESYFRMVRELNNALDALDSGDGTGRGNTEAQTHDDATNSPEFRLHFLASVVIGQALFWGVSGNTSTPTASSIRVKLGEQLERLEPTEQEHIVKTLTKLESNIENAKGSVAAVRLGELCAITHSVMCKV